MIKANELRIGNIVMETIYDFEPKQIVINREHFSQPEDYYEPIPLTEEWLIRFGFQYQNGHGWIHNELQGVIWLDERLNKTLFHYYHITIPMEFVHTLQNYFFAQNQTELTLKND